MTSNLDNQSDFQGLTKAEIKQKKREAVFHSMHPWKSIFIMVVPTIIAILIIATYQIIDKLIAVNFGAQQMLSKYGDVVKTLEQGSQIINVATSYATVPYTILAAFALFVSIGTAMKFSIFYGQRDYKTMNSYIGNGFLFSLLLSVAVGVVLFFLTPYIIAFQANGNAQTDSADVQNIIFKEAVFFSRVLIAGTTVLFLATFWIVLLRSEGKFVLSTIVNIIGALTNIIFDFIFVLGFKMGMDGTAYATVLSWVLIMGVSILIIYFSKTSYLKFKLRDIKLKWIMLTGIALIGLAPMLESLISAVLATLSIRILNTLPEPSYLNVTNVPIYVQLYGGIVPWIILINAPIIGISQGARALVGYVYGTKNYYRLWQIVWRLTLFLLTLLILSVIMVVAVGQYLIAAFKVDLGLATHYKIYIILQFVFYPLATLHYIATILYQSINRGKIALFAGLQRTVFMPAIGILLGYFVSKAYGDAFYFFLFVGLIDVFAAFVLLPMLIVTYFKSRKYVLDSKHENKENLRNPRKFINNESKLVVNETN